MTREQKAVRALRADLRILEREVERALASQTGCCGVTVAQCHLLLEVEQKGQTGVTDLASALELDKSTMSRTVESLYRAGLLNRRTDASNRRQQLITLTGAGKAKAGSINTMCDGFYARILGEIPRDKRALVAESIGLLAQAMRRVRGSGQEGGCE